MNVWRHFKPLVLKKKICDCFKNKNFWIQLFSMVGGGVLINSVNK